MDTHVTMVVATKMLCLKMNVKYSTQKRCTSVFGYGVLSWVEEEELCNYDHVTFGLKERVDQRISNALDMPEDLKGGSCLFGSMASPACYSTVTGR